MNRWVYGDSRAITSMDELDDSMTDALGEMQGTVHLILDARHGRLEAPDSMTMRFRGDTRAEALGHAYHLRDMLHEEGFSAEAEYIGDVEQPDWSSQPMHKVRLSWE